jgi:hypothetical protein
MDIESIRQIVDASPQGVRIVMIDGTRLDIPHRDFISLGPGPEAGVSKRRVAARTAFTLYEVGGVSFRIVNSLLVKEVVPLSSSGKRKDRRRKAS